jgi:hypothetical protein
MRYILGKTPGRFNKNVFGYGNWNGKVFKSKRPGINPGLFAYHIFG